MEKDRFVSDFIDNPDTFSVESLVQNNQIVDIHRPICEKDVCVFKVKTITFEEDGPRKEAVENVLSAMRLPFVNFFYLIKGDRQKVSFYYGISRDLVQYKQSETDNVDIEEQGISVLKRSIEGNFRGSCIEKVSDTESKSLLNELNSFKDIGVIEGVPGLNKDDSEDFQRVDRLVDVMLGDEYAFLVTAKFLTPNGMRQVERNICNFYEKLIPLSKKTLQIAESESVSENSTDTKGTQNSKGENHSSSHQTGTSSGSQEGGSSGKKSISKTNSNSISDSNTNGTSYTVSESKSIAVSHGKSTSKNTSNSIEFVDKNVQNWLKYIDEILLPRIDYGKGIGTFNVAITLLSNSDITINKLANTATSLFSGESGNRVPLTLKRPKDSTLIFTLKNLQVPMLSINHEINDNEILARTACSQYTNNKRAFVSNWYSVNELGVVAGLPRKEVVGLSLNEEIEFGINFTTDSKDQITIGNLVQSGQIKENIPVTINSKDLSKHIFVCGVTGSGKTTTCMSVLKKSSLPFLVIEPAKTEYRILVNEDPDVLVFTLGSDDVAPFRLNPLEFLQTETISSHVDMVKASIEAAFDMEAAIPQIIEAALYDCYEAYGWNVQTNKNNRFTDPFANGIYSFPMLNDLIKSTEKIVDKQGFDERLKNDYLGSIRARLNGLVLGAKGTMLNTPRSINFNELLHRRVVIELENVKSGTEKSLIMGFILSRLNESIKYEFNKSREFKHITLVEEAHRLLSKYMPGDSLNKKNGVEVFADMLAEIRKYGECLIIADQIPNKMTPDVLKNTNTKIVHKIFAQDDKEAIGNTMSLSEEQKGFLSNLVTGRAVVFSQGWNKSIQVQIKQLVDTTSESIDEKKIRMNALMFYAQNYKSGMIPEIAILDQLPSVDKVMKLMASNNLFSDIKITLTNLLRKPQLNHYKESFASSLEKMKSLLTPRELSRYLNISIFNEPNNESEEYLYKLLLEFSQSQSVTDIDVLNKYNFIINSKSLK
jgi:hypothetical protein